VIALTAAALRRAAVRATLAPSVRNSQPWRFVLRESSLEIHADWNRRVPVVDRDGHQLLTSCGAAIFNARVSLAAGGYETVVDRYPDPLQPDLLARLTIGPGRSLRPPPGELDAAVGARHSNRQEFTDEEVPVDLVAELAVAASAEGAELVSLATSADQQVAARLTALADSLEEADPAYRAEVRAWAAGDRHPGLRLAHRDPASSGTAVPSPPRQRPGHPARLGVSGRSPRADPAGAH
jgi:hypothetical protein